ncbi:MAG: hypothetical protein PHS14_12135 [Elusimicrobia bacterium]|nr:hypothetical protein [Elusimicrobiota bacterium]
MNITWLRAGIVLALISQSAGCGTILHPERKGQQDGRIDPGIAVLDGIGLLFFIIPGVIAFAVDFTNGTIYLPGGKHGAKLEQLRFDPKGDANAAVERIIRGRTGLAIRLNQRNLRVRDLGSREQMLLAFARAPESARAARQ